MTAPGGAAVRWTEIVSTEQAVLPEEPLRIKIGRSSCQLGRLGRTCELGELWVRPAEAVSY